MRLYRQPRRALSLMLTLCLGSFLVPLLDRSDSSRLSPASAAPNPLAALPMGWPGTLQLGMADSPGGAAAMRATAPFGFRYQYLAGGANTGSGWATWNPDGSFVTYYIQDSVAHGITPVFTYYQLLQSNGPCGTCDEKQKDLAHLNDPATMTALYNDLKLFYQRAGAFPNTRGVLHVEPDLWGYIQQASRNDDATTVPAKVAATGLAELAGLPDNAAGFARAVRTLRDTYAPNVVLGYHLSIWGTGNDIQYSKPSLAEIDALARRSATFYRSLGADFEVAFGEFSDRDAAFYQYQWGNSATWMTAEDFARHARYMGTFSGASGKRVVLWQIPYGNTKMRALNNTWNHYQDNRVEWLLDDPTRAHLNEYVQAGVIAFLFGRGADGATCACDAARDGVTNPEPINGNTGVSLSADDDGGFFRQKAAAYYSTGALPLPGGSGAPTSTPPATATIAPTKSPTPSPVPSSTRTPSPLACSPRPPVQIAAAPSGTGQLRVTVTATGGAELQQLDFGAPTNGLIEIGGQSGLTGNTTTLLASGTTQTTFAVRRVVADQATTVPLTVRDSCGGWPTFVGGGPTAF